VTDLDSLARWMDAYGAAWKSNERSDVEGLFAPGAVYSFGPFREDLRGRDRIVDVWVADPGAQRDIEFEHEPLAVEGNRGIAHWRTSFTDAATGARVTLDGVLVLTFDDEGRCTEHREWFNRHEEPV
jgi:SnoaL-like protein